MSSYHPQKLIDFHVHVFPNDVAPKAVRKFTEYTGRQPYSDGTVAGTLAVMDEAGIDICVPMPVAMKPKQVRDINDWACSIRSERIIPFAAMHPYCWDISTEIGRIVDMGFKGIKLQPDWQGFYPDEERALLMYEAAQDRLAVMFHVSRDKNAVRSTAERLIKIRREFPDLTMIAAHMGGYQTWHAISESLVGSNIYFDMSHCPDDRLSSDEIIRIIRQHSADKILFASDLPFAAPRKDTRRFLDMPLTDDEKEDIAWRNAARLLGITF